MATDSSTATYPDILLQDPLSPPIRDTNPTTVRASLQRITIIQRVVDASKPIIAVYGSDASTHSRDDTDFLAPFREGDTHLAVRA
jgi:hypothetical protein